MPPITYAELCEKRKQKKDLYSDEIQAKNLQDLPTLVYNAFRKAPALKSGRRGEIQDAIHSLIKKDPLAMEELTEKEKREHFLYPQRKTRPLRRVNREKLEDSICLLEELGDFLGAPGPEGHGNVYQYLLDKSAEPEKLADGLQYFCSCLKLDIPFEKLEQGEVYAPTAEEKRQRNERREQLEKDRKTRKQKYEEAVQAIEDEKLDRVKRSKEADKLQDRDDKKENGKRRGKEEQKEAGQKPEAEAGEPGEQKRRKELQNQAVMRSNLQKCINTYQNGNATAEMKKINMAMAAAFQAELDRVGNTGDTLIDVKKVQQNMDAFYKSAEFALAEANGTLDQLTSLKPDELYRRISEREREVQSTYREGAEDSEITARNLWRQMDRTWRVKKNSAEFEAARDAMKAIYEKDRPATRGENYVAGETVKRYIQKNIHKAKSATGRARMAIALAFLKQTMVPEKFEAYCNTLNGLRQKGKPAMQADDPRYFDPRTVGTIDQVYHDCRERIASISREHQGNDLPKPDARDLAMLTALSRMKVRAGAEGGRLAVDKADLEAEISAVQADRRFQEAYRDRSGKELIDRSFFGTLDSLEGYSAPAPAPEQLQV